MSVPVFNVKEVEPDDDQPVGSISIVRSGYVIGSESDVRAWAEDEFDGYELKQAQFYIVSNGDTEVVVVSNKLQNATEHVVKEHDMDISSAEAVDEIDVNQVDATEFDRRFNLTHGLVKLA